MSKQFVMTYQSSFPFESSHFNGPAEYSKIDSLIEAYYNESVFPKMELITYALEVMEGTHGHNFRATVFLGLTSKSADNQPFPVSYLIDDVALASVVSRYNRKNLSVVEGFRLLKKRAGVQEVRAAFARRATTENLAKSMLDEIIETLRPLWPNSSQGNPTGDLCVRVTINETNDIHATAEEWLHNVMPRGV